jgi:dihydroorotase
LFIQGARLADPSGSCFVEDILIQDGIVQKTGLFTPPKNVLKINAGGLVCLPGLVDMHVHLREPGQTHKEDMVSGSRAAAAGGVTALLAMPNTIPPCDSPEAVRFVTRRGASLPVRVYQAAAASKGLAGEQLNDFSVLKAAGAIAVSDDGRPLPDAGIMKQALIHAKAAGLPFLSHCEDFSLSRGGLVNEGEISRILNVPGFGNDGEAVCVARDVAVAECNSLPVHICHVSTAESVNIIRSAKARGVSVTCETAPHYFTLTEDLLLSRDADYRMNPPLRTRRDMKAVLAAITDGTIDALATDHAPHSPAEKADFFSAPNGVIGLETLLAVSYTRLVKPGHITLWRLAELTSQAPSKILRLPFAGIKPGAPADFCLFDPDWEFTVEPEKSRSKSRNTPFKGMTFFGKVKYTICRGKVVFDSEHKF